MRAEVSSATGPSCKRGEGREIMSWRRIGVAIALIVASFMVLGRGGDWVVDWVWFSTIGYAGVFWTVFATKALLLTTVFALSTSLLFVNATVAVSMASRRRVRLPAAFTGGHATIGTLSGTPADVLALVSPLLKRRSLILAVALCIALLFPLLDSGPSA